LLWVGLTINPDGVDEVCEPRREPPIG